jgi:hypothetical protein
MTSENELGFVRPGGRSPSAPWDHAHDTERDSQGDDWRVVRWLIDLEDVDSDEGPESSSTEREKDLRRELRLAQNRVGSSGEDRLRWLLRFASASPAFSEEQLQCEILAFTVAPAARFVPCEAYVTRDEIALHPNELHLWVQSGLLGLKRSIKEGSPFQWSVRAQESHHFSWLNGRLVDQPSVDDGELGGDRFKAQVCNILVREGFRVRLCQNCDRFFVGYKRQTYCTPKCSNIKRTKRYRERHPERIPEQRHKAHVRKQQRLHGRPNVKVGRRPRRAKP